ncbi:MAG: hypothetical protein M3401_14810 [Actinomycetota bacterium]|nr:hypothetical protein [Actinomycetota bacterium]
MILKKAAIVGGFVVALAAAGPAQAAPPTASCNGQFFSGHAGLVPATGGEERVGGFISGAAREPSVDFGGEISGAAQTKPHQDCDF